MCFKKIFEKAKTMSGVMEIPIEKPKFQRTHPIQNVEEFYRVMGYIPLVDLILEALRTRFSKEVLNLYNIPYLLPKNTSSPSIDTDTLISQLADEIIKFEKKINNWLSQN